MPLDAEIRKQLRGDYELAQQNITSIIDGTEPNYLIKSPDYKSPTVLKITLPLDDTHGSMTYWRRIRDATRLAIMLGSINLAALPEGMPLKAPKYLCDLVR